MALTVDDVRRIADLAKLRLTPGEEESLASELGEVVSYFEALKRQTEVSEERQGARPCEAEDRFAGTGAQRELFLANAPERLDDFLVVPRVHGDE